MIAGVAWLATGCGGVNASHSVSPASFLLPGLMKADPPKPKADPTAPAQPPAKEVAFAR